MWSQLNSRIKDFFVILDGSIVRGLEEFAKKFPLNCIKGLNAPLLANCIKFCVTPKIAKLFSNILLERRQSKYPEIFILLSSAWPVNVKKGILFETDAKWLFHYGHPNFLLHIFFLALISSLSPLLFLCYLNTQTHTNKAAEAAGRELIQADRTQWHPWHFRGRPAVSRLPKGACSGSGRQISLIGSGWLRAVGRGQWGMLLSSHFCQGTGNCEMKTSTYVLLLDMQLVEGVQTSVFNYTCSKNFLFVLFNNVKLAHPFYKPIYILYIISSPQVHSSTSSFGHCFVPEWLISYLKFSLWHVLILAFKN